MISTLVTLVRGRRNIYLNAPNIFSLYWDSGKLPTATALSSDTPYFLEIEYSESDYPDNKTAYSGHRFDYKTKKVYPNPETQQIPNHILRAEYLKNKKREIQYLLLPFADVFTFDYAPIQGWFVPLDDDLSSHISRYGQLSYFQDIQINEPDQLFSITGHEMTANPPVLLVYESNSNPSDRRVNLAEMFTVFQNAQSRTKRAVLNACRQYHKSEEISIIDPVAAFLYKVYAIETLINTEYSNEKVPTCRSCGQKRFSVRKKFHDFIEKYYNNYNKKDIDRIYNLRSAIVHTGNAIIQPGFFLYNDTLEELRQKYLDDRIIQITKAVLREVINRFLFMNATSIEPLRPFVANRRSILGLSRIRKRLKY